MGRRLPFLLALSVGLGAQERYLADVHVTVNLDAVARDKTRLAASRPIPRPKRIPSRRIGGYSPARVEAPHEAAAGNIAYSGFGALLDGYNATPPDSGGAVGPHHVVTMLNSQVSIQSRTGDFRENYPIDLYQFWSALGPFSKVFDPRILYDSAADRWVAAAGVNPGGADGGLLLAVSRTGDPGGDWDQFEIRTGAAGAWADYPVLGLNRNWIVLSANLFALPPAGAYSRTQLYVFNRAALYQGDGAYVTFSDSLGQLTPAVDLDQQSDELYFAQAFTGTGAGRIRISVLQGPLGSETFIAGLEDLATDGPWADAGSAYGDFAPQRGIWYKVDTGDSRLQNCVFRNASIWCAQTVFLPASKPTRSAVQWFQADPSSAQLVQLGRVEDPQSLVFYAFPSISVNRTGDALVGYTRFTANDYPSAGFSLRQSGDPASAMRPGVVFKQGEAPYAGVGADEGSNRWGDVSGTVVDPVDDLTFWTIQEYAATPTDHYMGRWGTWWASVPVSADTFACSYSMSASSQQFEAGGGKATVSVTTSPGCPWMAASNSGWITISAGSPGTGSGTVSLSVSPNSAGQPLTGGITVAGQTLTISQSASAQ